MSTKVPIVKVKIFEILLFYIGFEAKRQSGSHVFTAILMGDIQLYHIMGTRI